jgi:hypothetical protein
MSDITELEIALDAGYRDGQADAAAEISALKEKLNEAREIMERINREMFEHGHRLPCMKALRVFLGVNTDV